MKRRTLVLTIIAGLLVFLGVLVFYLPASWAAGFLPAQVKCSELGGSIWSGECIGLVYQGNGIGDATWNLAPASALTGRLVGDVDVRGALMSGRADLDLKFDGTGELRNVTASFPLDPAFVSQFPSDRRGNIVADLKRVVLASGHALGPLQGTIELRDLRQVVPSVLSLGSYRLSLDGATQPGGVVTGQLRDIGGPLAFDGTLTLTPPNVFVVQGYVTGRTADAERLVRQITVSPPDASGRSEFRYEDSY
ncbi:MAG TPA: type II secretion system protein N [Steroidobacteraceae bacterium]|nr:type II secretion system protein N [Steroidobacteraceae bacterium]